MIDSIEIRNYRNLNELKINSLAHVNLITGKNNAGKSSLLEAVAINAQNGSIAILDAIIRHRGEYFIDESKKNLLENKIKCYSSLFTGRIADYKSEGSISINTVDTKQRSNNPISIRLIKYYYTDLNDQYPHGLRQTKIIEDDKSERLTVGFNVGLEVKYNGHSTIIPFDKDPYSNIMLPLFDSKACQFIRSYDFDVSGIAALWDNITLTDKENSVIEALRVIEPRIDRIAFIQEYTTERTCVIKLLNEKSVFPIRSMGDGINRVLTIILAMVNSENGYFLIDEFENGLHHSVQRKLWDIIFKLSERLNVQVFATTHSEDSIYSFQQVLNERENKTDGKLIRLENKKGRIVETEFDSESLQVIAKANIEIR